MKALSWILVLVLLAVAGFLFVGNKKSQAELTQLRQESAELPVVRAALEEAKKLEAQNGEVLLASKEREELIRLRNEVGQLRRDKSQLATQTQQLQRNSEKLLEAQQAQQNLLVQQSQQLTQQTQLAQADKARNGCINNLRQLEAPSSNGHWKKGNQGMRR